MIKRYSVSDIEKIWSDDYKYQTLLKVELSLLNTLEHMNIVPQGTTKKFDHVKICTERIKQIEATTKHDVIAFCTSITEQVEEKYARFFHYGVTSSDMLDTALMLQIKECIHILIKERNFPNESKLMYKAASGAMEYMNIFEVSNINSTLKNLKEKNFWVYGFDGKGDKNFTKIEWKGNNILLFGSEGSGMHHHTSKYADFLVKIEINEKIDSLNISNSAAIVFHHLNYLKK